MISNAIHLSELKVGVIINASSGGYDLECEHKMLDVLKGAGIVEAKIWCGDTDQMERSFTEATRRKLDVLVGRLLLKVGMEFGEDRIEANLGSLQLERACLDLGNGQHLADDAFQSAGLAVDHVQTAGAKGSILLAIFDCGLDV